MKEIFKGSAIIFAFKVLGAVSLFLVHILISRYYGAQTLGVFNLILALMMMGTIFARVGLDMYVVRVIPSLENEYTKISLFLKEVFKIVFLGGMIVSISLFLLSNTIDTYIFKSFDASDYLLGLAIVTLPFAFFNVLPEIFRAFHDVKIYSFFRNLSQNLLVLLILWLGLLNSFTFDPVYTLYGSIVLITFLLFLVLYKFLKKHNIDLSIKGKYKGKILAYSYPMFLTSSMMFLMGYVDSFMISYYLDEYQVGIYSACIKLSFAITFILASINGFIAPKISQAYADNDYTKIRNIYIQSIQIVAFFTIPIFALLFIFPEFFLGLFGDEFKSATSTLLIVNMGYLISALCGSVGYILNMTGNQKIFMKIILISLIMNVLLNIILIPLYGLDGAATATLVSLGLWNIVSLSILKIKKII